jgi:hypothetical protein
MPGNGRIARLVDFLLGFLRDEVGKMDAYAVFQLVVGAGMLIGAWVNTNLRGEFVIGEDGKIRRMSE